MLFLKNNIILIFVGLFAFLQALLVFIIPEIDFFSGFISLYGIGKYSLIFSLSLWFLVIAKAFLIQKVASVLKLYKFQKLLKFFIWLSLLTTVLIILFPTDTDKITTIGLIHGISAYISFISTGVFLVLFGIIKNDKGSYINKIGFLISTVYFIWLLSFSFVDPSIKGLNERLLVLTLAIGISFNAYFLNRPSPSIFDNQN